MPDVLIVDDDLGFVETSALLLRSDDGYTVATAGSISAARTAVSQDLPRTTLLDWKLPDGTALDVLRWRYSHGVRVPTAIVTGFWVDPEWGAAQAEARHLGVEMFFHRGIDVDEPTAIVARLLDPLWLLHLAVLRGDEAARDALAGQVQSGVISRLRARFPTSPDLLENAAIEATYQYLEHPQALKSEAHTSIVRFVYGLARRLLWNDLRSERRRHAREQEFARRIHLKVATSAGTSPGRRAIERAIAEEPDSAAKVAIRTWLDGDRRIDPWLAIPSVRALPQTEQRADIERRKDALRHRVKRLATHFPPAK
jgi:CheY-like chemotaxis protein